MVAADARTRPERLGRYELLFELARGGMGVVHAARLVGAHGFDRLFAVKRLYKATSGEQDFAALLAEARVTARINHPNVVQTFELGEHDGAPFIVMQLVEGVSLAALLRRMSENETTLDPDLAAWIVAQAATGLHAAHELVGTTGEPLNLVHRDVSPRNVLLSYAGHVYVADFGIAKLKDAERSTTDGVVKGTFAYMSPEQASGKRVDRRSDVFALGVMLHEALTGERLFAADAPGVTVFRVVSHAPANPREVRPEVPQGIASIAMRCLEKDPEKRFAMAGEVADALRRSMKGRRAPIDEANLAELLGRLFAKEREKLRERIREGAQSVSGRAAAEVATLEGPSSVVATTTAPAPRGARPWRWGIAAVAIAGVTGTLAVWGIRRAPQQGAAATGTTPAAVDSTPISVASAEEAPSPLLPVLATFAPTTPATTAPKSARPLPLSRPNAPRPAATPPPTPPPPPPPPPTAPTAASPSSHKGVPFSDFDK